MSMFGDETVNALILRYRDMPDEESVAARNRQTLMDALEALAAGDLEAFWSIFDADVVFHEAPCLPYGGVHRGLAATKQAFYRMGGAYSHMRAEIEAVLAGQDMVVLYQTIEFRVRETGKTGALPVTEVFRLRDGKVAEWRAFYFDSNMVADALAARC